MRKYSSYMSLALIAFLAGCNESTSNSPSNIPIVSVKNMALQESNNIVDSFYYPAVLEANERAELSFRAGGEVISLHVREGETVRKGQLIAKLDPTDFQLKVDNAFANYKAVDHQHSRSYELLKQGMLAQSQFDEIAAKQRHAKAEYELAKLRLSFSQLKAPRDGVISRVHIEEHENVSLGQPIVNIHDSQNINVSIQVADKIVANIPKGADRSDILAKVKIEGQPLFDAYIKEVTTEKDHNSAAYKMTFSMPVPKDTHLFAGMAVEILTTFDSKQSARFRSVIPIEAVVVPDGYSSDQDNKFVWVLNQGNSVELKRIQAEKLSGNQIIVTEGLNRSDTIVTGGLGRLRDGMVVEPVFGGNEQ